MPLTRVRDWDTKHLHSFLMEHADVPFQWGSHDCALFVADAIKVMTSTDIAEDFRGYTSELEAHKTIKTVTKGTTLEHAVEHCAAKHGLEEWKHPLMAQRGDLVLVEDSGRLIFGIVHLSGRHVVAAGKEGLKRLSINSIKRAWKV